METLPGNVQFTGVKKKHSTGIKKMVNNYQLYLFVLPAFLYFVIFCYIPIYGVQIAFKDFNPVEGIWNSPWAGFDNFERFFNSFYFEKVIKNTLGISLYALAASFPVPIILALMLNEVKNNSFKRIVQTVTYAPHFISTVVLVGMLISFLSPGSGIVNIIIEAFGGEPVSFMQKPEWFKTIYVLSGIWQNAGWGSIIYLASLSGIDVQQYEAATIDGASRLQKIFYINIPGILPTIMITLILNAGQVMNVGFEKVFLMQNALNSDASEVISTYVYKSGLISAQYSFSAAVGLFNSVINFILLAMVNQVAKKLNDTSLW